MKRKAGDRWGMISVNKITGEKKQVQIGYWESTTFPYFKQAQEYVDGLNENAIEFDYDHWYEVRYVGNVHTGYAENDDVINIGAWMM